MRRKRLTRQASEEGHELGILNREKAEYCLQITVKIPSEQKKNRSAIIERSKRALSAFKNLRVLIKEQDDPSSDVMTLQLDSDESFNAAVVYAYVRDTYLLLADLASIGVHPDHDIPPNMLPLVSYEGFVTPISFRTSAEHLNEHSVFQTLRLGLISTELIPHLQTTILAIHINRSAPVNQTQRSTEAEQHYLNEMRARIDEFNVEGQSFASSKGFNDFFFHRKFQLINRAFGFAMLSATCLAAGVAAILFIPPPIGFAVAGVCFAASIINLGFCIYNVIKRYQLSKQIAASTVAGWYAAAEADSNTFPRTFGPESEMFREQFYESDEIIDDTQRRVFSSADNQVNHAAAPHPGKDPPSPSD